MCIVGRDPAGLFVDGQVLHPALVFQALQVPTAADVLGEELPMICEATHGCFAVMRTVVVHDVFGGQ